MAWLFCRRGERKLRNRSAVVRVMVRHRVQTRRSMQFSAMTMNMFVPGNDDPGDDNRIIDMAVAQSIWLAELGYHVWFTDHHFRGPWHSNPMQFAAYVAPLIPRDRYMGFGVLSIPFYHPVRLIESMNLLDQLTKGKVLFGVGSGWQGTEPNGLGVDPESHASGRLAEETLDVMEQLWRFQYGDPEYSFSVGSNSGRIKRRIMPSPYSKPYPTIIRVATREAGIVRAAQKRWPVLSASSARTCANRCRYTGVHSTKPIIRKP